MERIKPPKSGIYGGIPMEDYASWDAVSGSDLLALRRSPAFCRWKMDHPEEPSPAMLLGQAVHAAVLEPGRFEGAYARLPEGDGRTREVKDAKAALLQGGFTVLSPDAYDACLAIREAVLGHPLAAEILERSGHKEVSLVTDPHHISPLIAVKGRPDAISSWAGGWDLVDLKTARSAEPRAFSRAIFDLGYHIKAALYDDLLSCLGQRADKRRMIFIVAENTAPHEVAVYELDELAIMAGALAYRRLLRLYADCVAHGEWPGYPIDVQRIGLPQWALDESGESVLQEAIEEGGVS